MGKYFCTACFARSETKAKEPEQIEAAFERQELPLPFEVERAYLKCIRTREVSYLACMRQGLFLDCFKSSGITSLFKVICGISQLSYGVSVEMWIDLFDISETTADLCLHQFCCCFNTAFGAVYLRKPTVAEVTRIEVEVRTAGFFRMYRLHQQHRMRLCMEKLPEGTSRHHGRQGRPRRCEDGGDIPNTPVDFVFSVWAFSSHEWPEFNWNQQSFCSGP